MSENDRVNRQVVDRSVRRDDRKSVDGANVSIDVSPNGTTRIGHDVGVGGEHGEAADDAGFIQQVREPDGRQSDEQENAVVGVVLAVRPKPLADFGETFAPRIEFHPEQTTVRELQLRVSTKVLELSERATSNGRFRIAEDDVCRQNVVPQFGRFRRPSIAVDVIRASFRVE